MGSFGNSKLYSRLSGLTAVHAPGESTLFNWRVISGRGSSWSCIAPPKSSVSFSSLPSGAVSPVLMVTQGVVDPYRINLIIMD